MADVELQKNLAVRHGIEEQFHDTKAIVGVDDFYGYGALGSADRCLWGYLGDLQGKKLLEIGCGSGEATLRFAQAGAFVTAIDISGECVNQTKQAAEAAGLADHVQTIHRSGEEIDFPSGSFDIVYGHAVLHHLNLDLAMPLLRNVLKTGGVAAFLEPLGHNPILNGFRKLTPHRRTPTEEPLHMSQLTELSRPFKTWEHSEFYFIALAAFIFYYGVKSRFLFQKTMMLLGYVDRLLFKLFPFLRRYAWVTVIQFTK